ncbi:MAG: AMP-binding protein [Deltaproteobacteria bacterium]|nr:AMP-binding protein [Deltaproteobacteria bacterium]
MNETADNKSYYDAFRATAGRVPDNTALIFLGSSISYSRLLYYVENMAGGLHGIGVRKGERVIMYLPNGPQWIITWLALLRLNAVPVPVTPIYTSVDLSYIAGDSGAETIIGMDSNFGYIKRALLETPLKRAVITTLDELLPWWKRLFGRAFNRIPRGKFTLDENIFKFKKLLKPGTSLSPETAPDSLVVMLYTGGTTGRPKGVPVSNALFLHRASVIRELREVLIPKGEDIVIQGVPLFHIFGMMLGGGSLLFGDTMVVYPNVNLDAILDHIQHYRVKTLFGVPALFRMILDHERLDQYDLKSIRYILSAGDVLPLDTEQRWHSKFGTDIIQGYGATETGAAVSVGEPGGENIKGSAGKIMPFQKAKVVKPDTLETVPPDQPGELLVSSANMITGYWNNPEETARCFVKTDGRLWYRTGDIVKIDEKGRLFFLDRTSDMIKHKGYRIAASEIDAVLMDHPTVTASCVVGVPDEKVGERIKAFVVLKEDVRGATAYDLIKWCRQRLPAYKVPQYVEFRDMLPKSKVGKLLRRKMRDEELRKRRTVS